MIFKNIEFIFIFIIFAVYTTIGHGSGSSKKNYIGIENNQVFNNMPALFEYLLEMLQLRPEILEQNDVVFYKRSIEDDENDHEKNDIKDDDERNDIDPKEVKTDMNEYNNDEVNAFGDNEDDYYLGSVGDYNFKLSSDEVAGYAVAVEKELEKYNNVSSDNET